MIRDATPDDAQMLAHVHVRAWQEAYVGLLPDVEIAKRDLTYRFKLWSRLIADGQSRIAVSPDVGFAQVGPQRDQVLLDAGYRDELYSFYVLRPAYGTGTAQALLRHALGRGGQPFSALVVEANARACGFYEKIGMRHLETRTEAMGQFRFRERAYVCDDPHHILHN